MKKKILLVLLIIILVFVICKIFNFIVINKVYKSIESFKESDNRFYSVSTLDKGQCKIILKDRISKYILLNQDGCLTCEYKNQNTNVNYYIVVQENEDLRIKIER